MNKLPFRARGPTPSSAPERGFKPVLPEIAKPDAKLQLIFQL